MSEFATARPLPGETVYELSSKEEPPSWITKVLLLLTCLLPLTLTVMYWVGKVKCDVVVNTTAAAMFAACLLLTWYASKISAPQRT